MFRKKTGPVADDKSTGKAVKPAAAPAPASPKPGPKTPQTVSKGKQAYESRRAQKAGVGLDKWMADKQRRAQADGEAALRARKQAVPEKPGLLRRLLDRAHKPL